MSNIKVSEYIFEFELNNYTNHDYIALYHSISMEVIFIKRQIYKKLKIYINDMEDTNFDKDLFEELKNRKVFVPIEYNIENSLQKTVKSLSIIRPTTLRLQLTEMCNLNCSYCQIERNYSNNKGLHMSEDIAIRSLNLFNKFAPKDTPKSIILTGGEPTLNFDVIQRLFESAKSKLDSYRFILFSNGTGISKEMAKTLKENNVLVLISLDGNEAQHDIYRKNFAGNGSFQDALKGFFVCKEQGCNVGISAVVATHNVDELESEILDFFINIKPDSLGLNFPHYLLNADNSKILSIERYADVIISAYKKLRNHGIFLENIHRFIEPFVKQRINAKECAALGRGITVLPDGTVGPCKTLLVAGKIGRNLEEIERLEKLEDDDEFLKWCNRSTYTLNCCKGCVGISLCGTGCTYDSYVINGNIDEVDKRICVLIKKVLEFLLEDLYDIVKVNGNFDIYIPTLQDRQRIYSSTEINATDLKRSAGHEI